MNLAWACTVVADASAIIPPPRVIPANGQCDNQSYSVCESGTTCFRRTTSEFECRSQCQVGWECERDVVQEFEQCGGTISSIFHVLDVFNQIFLF